MRLRRLARGRYESIIGTNAALPHLSSIMPRGANAIQAKAIVPNVGACVHGAPACRLEIEQAKRAATAARPAHGGGHHSAGGIPARSERFRAARA